MAVEKRQFKLHVYVNLWVLAIKYTGKCGSTSIKGSFSEKCLPFCCMSFVEYSFFFESTEMVLQIVTSLL